MRLKKSHVVSGVLALALIGATGTAWYFAMQAQTPAQRAEEAAEPEDSVITVRVDQDQLIETLEFDAVFKRTGDFSVPAPAAPEGIETALASKIPLEVGDEVKAGTVILEVSGRPMIALEGDVPAYRDLTEGDTGPDVKQLQLALQQLYGTPQTGTFDARTVADVKKLYDNVGYDHATKSEEVATEGTGEEDTAGGDEGAEGDTGGDENTGGGQAATVERVVVPSSEVVFLPDLPMQVSKINAQQSAPVGTDQPVMVLASGDWKLEAKLDEETAAELSKENVELEFGDGPMEGQEVGEFELEVREEAAEQDDSGYYEGEEGEQQTQEVTYAVFAFDAEKLEEVEELVPEDEQEVTLVKARSAEDALIVPLSALWTDGEGRTMLTVLEDEGGKERHVEVKVTLRHDGRGVVEPVEGELAKDDEVVIAWRDRENA
ncbi:hypothetical protein AB0K52_17330 [Glycomyces sp. NPDC049804]|uniref:hypothetical protein n=1 Tax=Glycomyces sp. NPDC049804 TaxID=3154363 RepID=UPI003416159E